MQVEPVNRHEVDARRAEVEIGRNSEIDIGLLNIDRPMQLVVCIEGNAPVLKLDLRVEDNIVVELIGWKQHDPRGVEASLPLAVGGRILLRPESKFAIGADLEAGDGRWGGAERILVGWRRRFERGYYVTAGRGRLGGIRGLRRPLSRFAAGVRHMCLDAMISIGLPLATEFACELSDPALPALELFDQLFVRRLRDRSSLSRSLVRKRAASGHGQNGSHGQRGGQTAVSLSNQGIERDRAGTRDKNATALATLPASRLLFALHRQPPSFSIER